MGQRRTVTVPIILVLGVIGYTYYTNIFIFIENWLGGLNTSHWILNALAFTITTIICIVTYWIAIYKDPGGVPSNFLPDVEDSQTPIQEIKRKGGDLRYCQKCSCYKPPRAHHCRVCKRCVLRMILLVGCVLDDAENDGQLENGSSRIHFIISGVLIVPLGTALSILLGWHVYLILQNKTTIEYHEGVRAIWLAEKVGNVYRHPYGLGPYQNLTTVLGPNIFTWVFPTSRHIGSGVRFQTAYDNMDSSSSAR
ncbi:hypothetical protein MKX01_036877 [Papaver californicum]|nr:hypothetical protein MKX01_036877 [Papaver californicum]